MILTCPSCRTRYRTDSVHFKPPGRDVRCAKCGEAWFQQSPEWGLQTEPEPVIAAASDSGKGFAPELLEGIAAFRMKQGAVSGEDGVRSLGLAKFAAWIALIISIAGIGWVFVQYRQTIVELWPQSAALYATLGLPANASGISITDVAYRQNVENGLPVLLVSGKLVNVTDRELPVPQIRVILFDDAKRELYQWTFDCGIASLKPGAESPFVTRLSSPPPAARNLNVRFAESGEAQ
jgi:predicted Zn finger-like uncharacterized protein